ncbi:glutamine amidotransferase [Roseinatronobacter thiooxidans]|uniref:Imidazole glycerol phosphate synthase subunit HisH n=1 Tax=Roseinatronobacter thiooxidans TaxID=121821 RepID=A0A2W7QWJ4_9RHOB|nr:imidazole glycerol phosphate synthase subunit HisH [Roseinatronobacter thiooxidans]PZX48057.1 glutamine amidotransferase [Roseinatronobacter thiooxidans]
MLTVLVDYDSGNLHSASKAFQRMAQDVGGGDVLVSARAEDVARADRIVLPGDGAYPACRRALGAVDGMVEALEDAVQRRAVPFMGICVGMQMLATMGREYEDVAGLDWIGGEVVRIAPQDKSLKVPHMGWNDLVIDRAHPVLEGLDSGDHAYFVHSYHFLVADPAHLVAHVDYAGPVTAIVARDTIIGMQFHPEKSQSAGLRMIANFLTWAP